MNNLIVGIVNTIAVVAFFSAASNSRAFKDTTRRHNGRTVMYQPLANYVAARQGEFDQIDPQRKTQLEKLSAYIREQGAAGQPVQLVFVCTHNSRRSQMSQLWAAVASETYGIRVATYSGGTESTAFNQRAVASMERAGLRVGKTTDDTNPIYHVRYSEDRPALTCFSKTIDGDPNPKQRFAAIMVCSQADQTCPVVPGASGRFAIPYVDPKSSDGTSEEAETYDERCAQIAREMLYVMSRVEN